jgi:hypothetical protein
LFSLLPLLNSVSSSQSKFDKNLFGLFVPKFGHENYPKANCSSLLDQFGRFACRNEQQLIGICPLNGLNRLKDIV